MPALPKDVAKQVAELEDGFAIMEDDTYELELVSVISEKQGKPLAGAAGPYWTWEFIIPKDAERYVGRKFWVNTSLSERAFFKMKEHFEAFGAPTDTNTDELIGRRCLGVVGSYVQQEGKGAGDTKNQIEKLLPAEGTQTAPKSKGKDAAKPDMF